MAYQFLRVVLLLYIAGAFTLSIFYLRYRRCSALEYAFWGFLAFTLPVIGPFFVIAARPGPRKRPKRAGPAKQASIHPKG